MRSISPEDLSIPEVHRVLLSTVVPRPIAFVSTIDAGGNVNLSPFSFFNTFSANPPVLVFSPSRRGRDATTKHTLDNVKEVPEAVVSIVTYSMVEQMSLSSSEYPKDVNEFIKAGFTELPSDVVRPPRVAESPVQFECIVEEVKELGQGGGAGNLVICNIVKIHIDESILDEAGNISLQLLDPVGRMGGNQYVRASGDAVFEVVKPGNVGIGVDKLPPEIKYSNILSGNDLGKLGSVDALPSIEQVQAVTNRLTPNDIQFGDDDTLRTRRIHEYAKGLIEKGEVQQALCILMYNITTN